jgi:hypothetical protein
MSELQNEEAEQADIEDLSQGADLAPDSGEQHEQEAQVDEEAKKQEATQKIINEKTFKAKQAERDLQAANDKLKALEDAEKDRQAKLYSSIPPKPDPYDDNFDQLMTERDAAIAAKARFDSNQEVLQQQQNLHQQQQERQAQEQLQRDANAYTARAVELGIKENELQAAGDIVGNFGMSEGLIRHIIADKDGPLITKHLAANPHEGIELATMSPFAVGAYLDTVREKAAGLKPKLTNAPDPAENLQGNSVDPNHGKYGNIKGAQFD